MNKNILVLNCSNSFLKFCIYQMPEEKLLCYGTIDSINSFLYPATYSYKTITNYGILENIFYNKEMKSKTTHREAILKMVKLITSKNTGVVESLSDISAIGHFITQGGDIFTNPTLVDENVIEKIKGIIPISPLHTPSHILGVELCKDIFGNLPQVAVFDTAFFSTMPPTSYMLGLPYEYYKKYKIRKYGAHGTSHSYVTKRVAEIIKKPLKEIKLITCHITHRSSITAIKNGKILDTTMGFTPRDGLLSSIGCGAVDPSAITYIMQKCDISPKEMDNIMNTKSGLSGIVGEISDYHKLEREANNGNKKATLAIDMQSYQIRKYIGSYVAAMDGVDVIVFTGGIGENFPSLRADIVNNLSYLGISLDTTTNELRGTEAQISTPDSRVKVYVIPTNEELMIARETYNLI